MDEIFNVGETILLDGEPLSLVTRAGVEGWIDQGVVHRYRYDQVRDPLSGNLKHRCLYEKDGTDVPFVLVGDRDSRDGARVILFDRKPDAPRADIEGPRAAGMKAAHVDELERIMGCNTPF